MPGATEENRIQKIGDPSNTLTFAYDDQGQRVLKRGQHGQSVYVNQFFVVRNQALASKHVFAGTTRIATKVEPGAPVGTSPGNGNNTNTTNTVGGASSRDTTDPVGGASTRDTTRPEGLLDKVKGFFGLGDHPGKGVDKRSDRANEVAQNTNKNPNLTGTLPGNNGGGNGGNGGSGGNNGGGNGTPGGGSGGNNGGGNGGGNAGPKDPLDTGGSFLYFYHPDHLGSTSYVTDANAEIYEHIEYFPFGETWVEEATNTYQRVPYRFTGKELDEETGLYYYGARYYDPRTSVWQSVDPILGKYIGSDATRTTNAGVFNPKNISLYGYTFNNPLRLIDPDGLAPLNAAERQVVTDSIKTEEKFVSHMYADSEENVTVGYGHLISSATEAAKLPLYHQGTNIKATRAEKVEEYVVMGEESLPNYRASYYEQFSFLSMSESDANKLMLSDMAGVEQQLLSKNRFPKLHDYPAEAQMAILDMAYNIGAKGMVDSFPELTKAIRNEDWGTAAFESNRYQVKDSRNNFVFDRFIEAFYQEQDTQ